MDPEVLDIAAPVAISGMVATFVAALIGAPMGALLAPSLPGRIVGDVALGLTRVLAPLLVGLGVVLALTGWRLDITFTVTVMAVTQASLGLVVMAGSTARAIRLLPPAASEQLDALRLGRAHRTRLVVVEVWPEVVRAAVVAFAAVTAVLGSALIAGGSIADRTRLAMSITVDEAGRRPELTAGLLLAGFSSILFVASLLSVRRLR